MAHGKQYSRIPKPPLWSFILCDGHMKFFMHNRCKESMLYRQSLPKSQLLKKFPFFSLGPLQTILLNDLVGCGSLLQIVMA